MTTSARTHGLAGPCRMKTLNPSMRWRLTHMNSGKHSKGDSYAFPVHNLAPPASMVHSPSEVNKFLSEPKMSAFLLKAANDLNFLDVIPYNWYISEVASKFCSLLDGWMCELLYLAG